MRERVRSVKIDSRTITDIDRHLINTGEDFGLSRFKDLALAYDKLSIRATASGTFQMVTDEVVEEVSNSQLTLLFQLLYGDRADRVFDLLKSGKSLNFRWARPKQNS